MELSTAVGGFLGNSSYEAVGSVWVLAVRYMKRGGEEELWQRCSSGTGQGGPKCETAQHALQQPSKALSGKK